MMDTLPTPRELDVVRLLATGIPNKQIADALNVGRGTVETHINSVFNKLNTTTRTAATVVALQKGWIKLSEIAVAA